MAEVVLFHHAQGLTPGIVAFADDLRRAGHTVHTPDLFEGQTFPTLEAGMAHVGELGFGEVMERGVRAVEGLPAELVYAGFSLGVVPAQRLAQTRAGARGALLCYSCIPVSEFGAAWPDGVPVQVHGMDADPIFVDEGDIDAARALVAEAADAELFLYPGNQHYFADSSLASYDVAATTLLTERVLGLLSRVDANAVISIDEETAEGDAVAATDEYGRPEPPLAGDEVETLIGFLEYSRATFAWKTRGLDDAGLRVTVGVSSMTLGGMLKHLAWVESYWFTLRLHGRSPGAPWETVDWDANPGWDWSSAVDDSPEQLRAIWQENVDRSRASIAEALAGGGLDGPAAYPWPDGRSPSLRWIVIQMIGEYNRHNGHADLIRESIDGETGE